MSNNIGFINLPIGSYNGATEVALVKVPDGFGSLLVLEANLKGPAGGTVIGGLIVTMSDATVPVLAGTVGAFAGTVVTNSGTVFPCTISDATIDEDVWIGFDQTSGTVPAGTYITLSYLQGV